MVELPNIDVVRKEAHEVARKQADDILELAKHAILEYKRNGHLEVTIAVRTDATKFAYQMALEDLRKGGYKAEISRDKNFLQNNIRISW